MCFLNMISSYENEIFSWTKRLTSSKIAIQKTAEATVDLIGNKIADKITSVSKKPSNNNNNNEDVELTTHKERYISPEEKQ